MNMKKTYLLVFFHGFEKKIIPVFPMDIRTKIIPVGIFPRISGQDSYHLAFSHRYQDKDHTCWHFTWISGKSSWNFPWISGQRKSLLVFFHGYQDKFIPVGIFPWIPGRQETPERRRRQLIPKLELLK
jgi:hypothetical protein